ncbi:aminotransferase, class I [Oceanobacter sp. RED65]|uniref:Aminotransferase n=2 Tax=Bermanella marisrubri TaxID=207949 RepID=Q1N101_9GAMM|nr:aminotransferase, class I [Oceanobacter sp. RED65] [Bermanella marisrubri]
MDLLARAKQFQAEGRDIIHLEVGEPDFPSLPCVISAGQQALANGHTHYTPALGLPQLRQVIAQYYKSRYQVDVDWNRIVITPGASGALQLVTTLLLDESDQIMLADPGYPCNRHFAAVVNAQAQEVVTSAKDDFHLTALQVSQHWQKQTKAVMVATPSNPTGAVMNLQQLQDLQTAIKQQRGVLIVDEIYQGLVFDSAKDITALQLSGDQSNLFVINSFSKYFAMTGWRLGWMVAPEWAMEGLDRLAQNIFLAANTPAQHAALAVFEKEALQQLDERKTELQKRRDFLLPELIKLGFDVVAEPEGAFYIFARISHFNHRHAKDSMAFCLDLLEKTGVAITPGVDFSPSHGHEYVRFAYTQPISELQRAMDKIKHYLM